jgi:hypothetical protein
MAATLSSRAVSLAIIRFRSLKSREARNGTRTNIFSWACWGSIVQFCTFDTVDFFINNKFHSYRSIKLGISLIVWGVSWHFPRGRRFPFIDSHKKMSNFDHTGRSGFDNVSDRPN